MNTETQRPASLAAAHGYAVRVRSAGPVTNLGTGEKTAVWPGDTIRVLSRVGSRRKCRVTYQHGECVSSFTALVPKRWLQTRRHNSVLGDSAAKTKPPNEVDKGT